MAKRYLLVILLFLVLSVVLTFPLILHFSDHVPGTTTWAMDEYGYVWNNWWFKHAVFDLGISPFHTDYIFYPVGTSLVLYTFTLLHVLLGLPLQFAFGLIPASNGEVLFSFVTSGFGAYLLARYLLRKTFRPVGVVELGAFAAGAVFAFASNRLVYAALGHYNVVATEWMPFYTLFLIKTVREKRWTNALLAGLFAALALYVETTDGVLLALFTVVYLAVEWRRALTRGAVARLAATLGTAAVLFAPLLVPTLNEILFSGYSLPGWGDAQKLVVDLFGFITPTSLNPLARDWVHELDQVRQGTARFVDINTVFLGYVTLALSLIGAARFWKNLKVWAVSAVAFAVLCLGPLLHINGQSTFDLDGLQVTFPMPYLLLHYIPLLKENRVPNRFSALVMLSLAVLAAFGIGWLLTKIDGGPKRWARPLQAVAFSLLLGALLFEHLAVPLPLTDSRVPDVYARIASEPGNFAVLTLPLGWRNSFGQQGAEDTRLQYYQSTYQKYTFAANIQRNPPFLFEYYDRIPIFHSITQVEFYDQLSDETLARDKALAPSLMAFYDVRYVVVQPPIPGRPPYSDTQPAVLDYIRKTLPLGDEIYNQDGVVAYKVNQAPLPARQQVDFGTESAHIYQAEGWDRDDTILGSPANWANQSSARIMFPVRDLADYAITLRALPFTYPNSPAQTMELTVNGESVSRFQLSAGWKDYAAVIPARLLHTGLNDAVLKFGYVVRPYDVMPADYAIGKTGVTSPVDIVVNAGDPAAGPGQALGSIKVNGRETSPLGRGYNVVQIDPKTGQVLDAQVFNTADDKAASRSMTDYIAKIPAGTIVAVASQEAVAGNLGDRTVQGLQSLGARVDARQAPDDSHAFIGVKGAAEGTALEQANAGTSYVSVGHDPDVRSLAAAVSTVTFEKK